MKKIVFAFLFGLAASLAQTAPVGAEEHAYTQADLQAAQAAGKPIIIDISAPWCTTCKAQAPIVNSLLSEPKYKNLVLFHVDFDTQKGLLRRINVREQSTFVAFKGNKEVGRSTGATDRASIEKLFDKTT